MSTITIYKALARLLGWNPTALTMREQRIERIRSIMRTAPHGAGICGLSLDPGSKPERMVFEFSYHHTADGSPRSYGYTEHKLTAKPCPCNDFHFRITGWKADYKTPGTLDYFYDTFHSWLSSSVEENAKDYEKSYYELLEKSYAKPVEKAVW